MRAARKPLAERLKLSLEEGLAFAAGTKELHTTVVPVGRDFTGEEVAAIRLKRRMTQAQFAHLLAVSVKTLQSWEQGVRKPSRPTMRLLQIVNSPEEFRALFASGE